MIKRTGFLFLLAFLFVAASLIKSDTAAAQTQLYVADTGVITLQPGQILGLSVNGAGSTTATIYFRKKEYADAGSTGGVVLKQLVSQTTSGSFTIAPDQSASSDFFYTIKGVRGEVVSTSRNVKVNAFVIGPAPTSNSGNGSPGPAIEQISFNFTNITLE